MIKNETTLPLISVALCTYNGARYLRKQLDSLLAQTYENIEIIAVDDCSADDTVQILNEYARRDVRLHVKSNAVNLGFRSNFENVLVQCRGDYIAPCDQDDFWHPEKIACLLAAIGNNAMAYCDSELIDDRDCSLGWNISDFLTMRDCNDPLVFVFDNCISGHAMIFRRELLKRTLPVPDTIFYDWWLAAAAASEGIAFCRRSLVRYRQHDGNITGSMLGRRPKGERPPPGFRVRHLREIGKRLEVLSALEGPHQSSIQRLSVLWHRRESQWISISLWWFMALRGYRLSALEKPQRSRLEYIRRSFKFLLGLRLKRLTNKYAYADPLVTRMTRT